MSGYNSLFIFYYNIIIILFNLGKVKSSANVVLIQIQNILHFVGRWIERYCNGIVMNLWLCVC